MIIEDESLAQDVIKSHLEKTERFKLTGTYRNALEARAALEREEVDLIFLDIQLPGMTGLNFLRSLVNPPLVVFTTAFPQYAVESYEFNVIDYLLKPISYERFSKTIEKIMDGKIFQPSVQELRSFPRDHIFIKSSSKFFRLRFADIIYIQGMKDYLKIYTGDHTIVTHQTMGEMENMLPADQFLRVHKSYIVALSHIKSVYGNSIEMGKVLLPIGSNYKERMMNFIAGRLSS
ncbi:MAG TPA: LytTR family DNA-binding domain-containing protein [Chitinophagaceae bacterium]|nr:LytTR family DNA-binding domain-containing protein [Chitinophagaceae bacterium]